MTLYIGDCEANGLYDAVTKFHCICFSPSDNNKFYIFCDLEELSKYNQDQFVSKDTEPLFFPINDYVKLLDSPKTTGICIHNLFKYDLPVFEKLSGISYNYNSINNRRLKLVDSLVLSQYLKPDRIQPEGCKGKHGLEAWGVRLGIKKPQVEDWSNQPLNVYINRVIEDVKINKAVYFALIKEANNVAISTPNTKGDWEMPLRMGHKNFYLIGRQEQNGVVFDEEYGWYLLDELDKEMKAMEDELNPRFGEREVPESNQLKFPVRIFKKAFDYKKPYNPSGGLKKQVVDYLNTINISTDDQEEYIKSMCEVKEVDGVKINYNNIADLLPKTHDLLTQYSINYCLKLGIEDKQQQLDEINRVVSGGEVKKLTEPIGLKDTQAVKEFLVKEGWKPTLWNFRNVLTHPKTKQKLSAEETRNKVIKYIDEFKDHVYWPFILIELGYSPKSKVDPYTESFIKKCIKNGRNLLSSPMYKDQNGIRCPNLKELTGDTSKKIIRYLSLKHRRSMLKSKDPKKKDTHGLLNNKRLKIDGRISAGVLGLAASNRKRHSGVVNIPKPKKEVVYGIEMRRLFKAPSKWWNIGADAASIEALVASHWTIPFDGGEYSKSVLTGKFHDDNAITYSKIAGREITRSSGKNITYALLYGASAKKIARMMSIHIDVANEVVDGFWELNVGLKGIRDAITEYWKLTNKKYIIGLDGRKLFSRSQHSLINLLFQNSGAILFDFALCYWDDKCTEENLSVQRWAEVHDELQFYQKKEEVQIYTFDSTPEWDLPLKDDKPNRKADPLKPKQLRDGKLYSAPKFKDGVWEQAYSRAGELFDEGFKAASKFYNTNVDFSAEYMWGKDWSECH
jgi:hypothetical protein